MFYGSGAAIIIRRQNEYIAIFTRLGAFDKEHAININEVGIRRRLVFERMCSRNIFIECGNGLFYMDVQAAKLFKEHRRIKKYVMLIIAIIFLVLYYLTHMDFLPFISKSININ